MPQSKNRQSIGAAALLTLAFGVGSAAAAEDAGHPVRLIGEMFVAGATLVDPPASEPNDARAYFHLSGAAARRLFDSLKAADTPDACRPGRRVKAAGHVLCSAGAKAADAECDFALDLANGTTASGTAC